MRTLLGGDRGVFFDPCKEVFEEVDSGVGTQEVICGASKYYNIIGLFCLKCVESMVNDILGKA